MTDERFCPFDECWQGRCGEKLVEDEEFCVRHAKQRCWCGVQAVKNCSIASSLVCGQPTCAEHECHHIAGGMTGSSGVLHSEKGHAQYMAWKEAQK